MIDETRGSFQTHPYLENRYLTVGRKLAARTDTRAAWQTWHRQTVRKLKSLTGYDTMVRTPMAPRITEQTELGDIVRHRLEIQTEPGVCLTAYILIPRNTRSPMPVMLAPHGHCSGGKLAVAGCREIPEVAAMIQQYNYDYGMQFARAGFITFCPDARGFGERREHPSEGNLLAASCGCINNMAIPLGQTVAGMWAWDLHRLMDYIQSREDCIPDRIGCAGLSGGGLQTLWAAALDSRIRCAVISGYLYGYRESLLDLHTNCSCNYVPHLYEYVDMCDIAALIAPRPLLVETGTRDQLNGASGLGNVYPQMRSIRKAYRLLGAQRLLAHDVFEGEHRWHGVKAIPWIKQHLMQPRTVRSRASGRRTEGARLTPGVRELRRSR